MVIELIDYSSDLLCRTLQDQLFPLLITKKFTEKSKQNLRITKDERFVIFFFLRVYELGKCRYLIFIETGRQLFVLKNANYVSICV